MTAATTTPIETERLICRCCGKVVEGFHEYLMHLNDHEQKQRQREEQRRAESALAGTR